MIINHENSIVVGKFVVSPLVTATDSGGTLEFVDDGVNGAVAAPEPHAIGDAVARLHGRRADAATLRTHDV